MAAKHVCKHLQNRVKQMPLCQKLDVSSPGRRGIQVLSSPWNGWHGWHWCVTALSDQHFLLLCHSSSLMSVVLKQNTQFVAVFSVQSLFKHQKKGVGEGELWNIYSCHCCYVKLKSFPLGRSSTYGTWLYYRNISVGETLPEITNFPHTSHKTEQPFLH